MSTQKNESARAKGQSNNSTTQKPSNDTTAQKGKGAEARKPGANAGGRDSNTERENDNKRPTANSKKN